MGARATIQLSIEPDLCGPISVGTVRIVKLVAHHLALGLSDAIAYVDRCVFEGAIVLIPAPSKDAAEALIRELPPHATARISITAPSHES